MVPMQDGDHCALLARETVQGGHSVLIFCGTKLACEITAKRAARSDDLSCHASCHGPPWGSPVLQVHPPLLHAYLSALNRMLEIPERQLRLKNFASSQRPSRASLLEELLRVPGGADPGLLECVARGAAFHHAGGRMGG